MNITRIKKKAVLLNKTLNKGYNFESKDEVIGKCIDTIQLDESLFTHYYAKWAGIKGEVFATDDFIKVEFEHDKDIIEKTIKLNNIEYVFYLASANDLKKSSAMFIKKELADTLGTDLIKYTTGNITTRLDGKDVVINKIQAYISFIFSGSIKTNLKPNVVVIEELKYKYKGLHTVLKNIETLEFAEEVIETELTSHDGQGIISKEFAEKIRQELNSKRAGHKQLKYIDWITFRLYTIGGKGMCVTVDIKKQLDKVWSKYGDSEGLKKINGKLYIKDIYNQWHDIESVDMILNESQTKLIKYFESNEDIQESKENIPDDYKDIINSLYVCKYNENNLRTDRTKLNYQFAQALALSPKDILELTKDDKAMLEQSLSDVDAMLIVNQLAEIKDINEELEENTHSNNSFDLALDLVKYDESFLRDKTVLEQIRRLYMSKIRKVSYGKVFIKDMAYRLMIQDIQVYLNFIATRDMETARDKDCLQAGQISVVGRPAKQKTVIGRNPLSSHQEMIRFENTRNNFIDSLGYKSNSMIVFNSYDAIPSRMSGADFDGDTCAVIVDNIIYNSIIELDTPTFFNTFDGMKKLGKYTKENIIEMTKIASGDKIGELALINTGLMNKCNDIPYFDYRINKGVSLDYIYKNEEKKVLENLTFDDIEKLSFRERSNLIWNNINKLESDGTIVNGLSVMTEDQLKGYIKSLHKQYRYEQYLILYAQQCAIDCSKTGIDIPKNVKEQIKGFSEKPYFLSMTGNNRNKGIKFRNSVLDRHSNFYYHDFNSKRIELLENIKVRLDIDVTEDNSFKNVNVIRNLFKRASVDANDNKANILVNYIKPNLDAYNKIRQDLRQYKNTDKEYYNNAHSKYHYEMKKFFNEYYINCKNNINDFTLEDLMKAVYDLKISSKYVLEFMPELLTYAITKMNTKRKVFLKGDNIKEVPTGIELTSKVIKLGNKVYTLGYENINVEQLENNVQAHVLQLLQKRKFKSCELLQIKSNYGTKFILGEKYFLNRKKDNKYLFEIIDKYGAVVDNVRITLGTEEFNEDIDVLSVVMHSYKGESKTKKYEMWFVERCA